MNYDQCISYVLKHGDSLPENKVILRKPLFVFKKLRTYNTGIMSYFQSKDTTLLSEKATRFSINNSNDYAIANLVIPIGTIINIPRHNDTSISSNMYKFRAETAFCWSIFSCKGMIQKSMGVSSVDRHFHYYSASHLGIGFSKFMESMKLERPEVMERSISNRRILQLTKLIPKNPFDFRSVVCTSGIHFFLDLESALNYQIF